MRFHSDDISTSLHDCLIRSQYVDVVTLRDLKLLSSDVDVDMLCS